MSNGSNGLAIPRPPTPGSAFHGSTHSVSINNNETHQSSDFVSRETSTEAVTSTGGPFEFTNPWCSSVSQFGLPESVTEVKPSIEKAIAAYLSIQPQMHKTTPSPAVPFASKTVVGASGSGSASVPSTQALASNIPTSQTSNAAPKLPIVGVPPGSNVAGNPFVYPAAGPTPSQKGEQGPSERKTNASLAKDSAVASPSSNFSRGPHTPASLSLPLKDCSANLVSPPVSYVSINTLRASTYSGPLSPSSLTSTHSWLKDPFSIFSLPKPPINAFFPTEAKSSAVQTFNQPNAVQSPAQTTPQAETLYSQTTPYPQVPSAVESKAVAAKPVPVPAAPATRTQVQAKSQMTPCPPSPSTSQNKTTAKKPVPVAVPQAIQTHRPQTQVPTQATPASISQKTVFASKPVPALPAQAEDKKKSDPDPKSSSEPGIAPSLPSLTLPVPTKPPGSTASVPTNPSGCIIDEKSTVKARPFLESGPVAHGPFALASVPQVPVPPTASISSEHVPNVQRILTNTKSRPGVSIVDNKFCGAPILELEPPVVVAAALAVPSQNTLPSIDASVISSDVQRETSPESPTQYQLVVLQCATADHHHHLPPVQHVPYEVHYLETSRHDLDLDLDLDFIRRKISKTIRDAEPFSKLTRPEGRVSAAVDTLPQREQTLTSDSGEGDSSAPTSTHCATCQCPYRAASASLLSSTKSTQTQPIDIDSDSVVLPTTNHQVQERRSLSVISHWLPRPSTIAKYMLRLTVQLLLLILAFLLVDEYRRNMFAYEVERVPSIGIDGPLETSYATLKLISNTAQNHQHHQHHQQLTLGSNTNAICEKIY